MLHSSITFPFYPDLGKNLGNLGIGGGGWGVFCNFGFGLREKSWKFGFSGGGGYSVTSDLDLGKKVKNLDFFGGGVFCNLGFGLREKVGNLDFGGVFCNFGFGLREKVGNLDFWGGGYSVTWDLDLGKKVENLDFLGGGIL